MHMPRMRRIERPAKQPHFRAGAKSDARLRPVHSIPSPCKPFTTLEFSQNQDKAGAAAKTAMTDILTLVASDNCGPRQWRGRLRMDRNRVVAFQRQI
ncbi:hypothetical protein GCM10022290_20580 [Sagittula marina]